jgi:hypothetical protein
MTNLAAVDEDEIRKPPGSAKDKPGEPVKRRSWFDALKEAMRRAVVRRTSTRR